MLIPEPATIPDYQLAIEAVLENVEASETDIETLRDKCRFLIEMKLARLDGDGKQRLTNEYPIAYGIACQVLSSYQIHSESELIRWRELCTKQEVAHETNEKIWSIYSGKESDPIILAALDKSFAACDAADAALMNEL